MLGRPATVRVTVPAEVHLLQDLSPHKYQAHALTPSHTATCTVPRPGSETAYLLRDSERHTSQWWAVTLWWCKGGGWRGGGGRRQEGQPINKPLKLGKQIEACTQESSYHMGSSFQATPQCHGCFCWSGSPSAETAIFEAGTGFSKQPRLTFSSLLPTSISC